MNLITAGNIVNWISKLTVNTDITQSKRAYEIQNLCSSSLVSWLTLLNWSSIRWHNSHRSHVLPQNHGRLQCIWCRLRSGLVHSKDGGNLHSHSHFLWLLFPLVLGEQTNLSSFHSTNRNGKWNLQLSCESPNSTSVDEDYWLDEFEHTHWRLCSKLFPVLLAILLSFTLKQLVQYH